MKLGRIFAMATLLFAATLPAMAGSDPAFSLHGLFSDDDCEMVPEILGNWTGNADLGPYGTWTLHKLGDRKYRLILRAAESDNGMRPAFDICAAHVGGYLFFDATFQELQPDGKAVLGSDESGFWIPLHLIGRLDIETDALHFRLLDDSWLQEAWKSQNVDLAKVQNDDGTYILAAPSKELKEFVANFGTDAQAFSFEQSFERAPAD
jgi:hypothetical protein